MKKSVKILRALKFMATFAAAFFALNAAISQVPVFEEPHHHVVLLNPYLRLIDVHVQPGDTTLYHRHFTASIVVFLTHTKTGSQPLGGAPSSGTALPGNSFFAPYGEHPIAHRVWNEDTGVYHVMDIEMLHNPTDSARKPLEAEGMKLVQDQKMVRVYHVILDPGRDIRVTAGNPKLLITIASSKCNLVADKSASTHSLEPASYNWMEGSTAFHIENKGNAPAEFVLLECR
jgi:hypothetical protein